MPPSRDPHRPLRDSLAALPGVQRRRMFNAEAYFVGPVLFAFLGPDGLVLRLPHAERSAVLREGMASEFLGPLPDGLHGWVVIPYQLVEEHLLAASHQVARGLARTAERRGRGRRTGRKRTKVK